MSDEHSDPAQPGEGQDRGLMARLTAIEHLVVVLWSAQVDVTRHASGTTHGEAARRLASGLIGTLAEMGGPTDHRDRTISELRRLLADIVHNADTRDTLGI